MNAYIGHWLLVTADRHSLSILRILNLGLFLFFDAVSYLVIGRDLDLWSLGTGGHFRPLLQLCGFFQPRSIVILLRQTVYEIVEQLLVAYLLEGFLNHLSTQERVAL